MVQSCYQPINSISQIRHQNYSKFRRLSSKYPRLRTQLRKTVFLNTTTTNHPQYKGAGKFASITGYNYTIPQLFTNELNTITISFRGNEDINRNCSLSPLPLYLIMRNFSPHPVLTLHTITINETFNNHLPSHLNTNTPAQRCLAPASLSNPPSLQTFRAPSTAPPSAGQPHFSRPPLCHYSSSTTVAAPRFTTVAALSTTHSSSYCPPRSSSHYLLRQTRPHPPFISITLILTHSLHVHFYFISLCTRLHFNFNLIQLLPPQRCHGIINNMTRPQPFHHNCCQQASLCLQATMATSAAPVLSLMTPAHYEATMTADIRFGSNSFISPPFDVDSDTFSRRQFHGTALLPHSDDGSPPFNHGDTIDIALHFYSNGNFICYTSAELRHIQLIANPRIGKLGNQ